MKHTRLKKEQEGIVRKRGQVDTVTQTVICWGDEGYLRLVRSLLNTAWKRSPGDSETGWGRPTKHLLNYTGLTFI